MEGLSPIVRKVYEPVIFYIILRSFKIFKGFNKVRSVVNIYTYNHISVQIWFGKSTIHLFACDAGPFHSKITLWWWRGCWKPPIYFHLWIAGHQNLRVIRVPSVSFEGPLAILRAIGPRTRLILTPEGTHTNIIIN